MYPLSSTSLDLVDVPNLATSSLESLESTNTSFYTAHSVFPSIGTSLDTNSQYAQSLSDTESLATRTPRIIAVMGPTGAGKSTLIKAATGAYEVKIGNMLSSCTQELYTIRCQDPSGEGDVIFVDTPGFDDTFKSDVDILEGVASWLKDTYQAGVKLSGILYLHRITDNRMTSTLLRNLDMFQNLCGPDALSSIILVTTNWDQLDARNINRGTTNEERLRTKYWRMLLDSGSEMLRFENTCSSAWNIVNSLPKNVISLDIQREMVEQGKPLLETAAGQSLSSWFQRTGQVLKNIIQRLELLMEGVVASPGHDSAEIKKYERRLREANEGLRMIEGQETRLSRRGSYSSAKLTLRRLKLKKRATRP